MKKALILFSLIFSYALVLGHSIVPHHHHDGMEQLAHSDDHDHDHHGDNHQNEHNGLPEFFSHSGHDAHTLVIDHTIARVKERIVENDFHFICWAGVEIPSARVLYSSDHPPGRKRFPGSQIEFSSRSLRAPPLC